MQAVDMARRPFVPDDVHAPSQTHAKIEYAIAAEVQAALEGDRLSLPTLPDVALRIQDLIDDPDVSADKIVNLLATDPAIAMHIIKAANSAMFHNGKPVDNLRSAISRLGFRMLRSIVMNVTMIKLFQAKSPLIDQQLKKLWGHSREVAAISYVLARQQKHLKTDQALLAGLVHDIGALPLYLHADRHHSQIDQAALAGLISKFSTAIGTKLLRHWNFPETLVDIIVGHENPQRASNSNSADYVDVVTMANLQAQGSATKLVPWENFLAVKRLGFCPADCQNFLLNHEDQIAEVRSMLQAGAA